MYRNCQYIVNIKTIHGYSGLFLHAEVEVGKNLLGMVLV